MEVDGPLETGATGLYTPSGPEALPLTVVDATPGKGFTDVMMTGQLLRALEMRRMVTRTPDALDARVRRLLITPAGANLAQQAMALVEAADEKS